LDEPMSETRELYHALLAGQFEVAPVIAAPVQVITESYTPHGQNPLDPAYLGGWSAGKKNYPSWRTAGSD